MDAADLQKKEHTTNYLKTFSLIMHIHSPLASSLSTIFSLGSTKGRTKTKKGSQHPYFQLTSPRLQGGNCKEKSDQPQPDAAAHLVTF